MPKHLSPELQRCVACFLQYSFRDIKFRYAGLTDSEKELCTEKQFKEICEWVKEQLKR